MAGIATIHFRHFNAEQLFESFSESSPSIVYFFIGRSWAWPNESSPNSTLDNIDLVDIDAWRDMLAAKRVIPADVSYCTRRYDWESGSVYAQYESGNSTLWANNFFVFTDDYNVYKCLSNHNDSTSIVKPTGTSTAPIVTSDGYIWKYMYTVTAGKAIKFLTANYIPIQTLPTDDGTDQWDVQAAAANGAIESITVDAGGSGYPGHSGTVQSADSSTVYLETGASGVNGKFVGSTVYITSGPGQGQLRNITGYNGSSRGASISPIWTTLPTGSSTYVVGPKVNITGDGSSLTAYSVVSGSSVDQVIPINRGQNYSFVSMTLTANGGSGVSLKGELAPKDGHGADAVRELSGQNIMLNVRTSGSESNTFTTNNEFRVLGLLIDPLLASNSAAATGTVYDQSTHLSLSSAIGTFSKDEWINGGTSGASGRVVDYYSSNVLRVSGIKKTFTTTETITGNTSGATATVSTVAAGALKPYEGRVIYMENRTAIPRSTEQIEDIKIIVKF